MEQIARRSTRAEETGFEELPLIAAPRRVEHDDDSDSDLSPVTPVTSQVALDEPALTERDALILAFEKQWWRHAGAKEQAIREQFGLSATRYYQILNGLLDDPVALERDPVLVGRLRRLRGSRSRSRGSR